MFKAQIAIEMPKVFSNSNLTPTRSYHFLPGAKNSHLPKADVEWGALKAPIGLANNDDVDASRKCGRVQTLVEFLHGDKHLACELSHVIHGLRLQSRHKPKKHSDCGERY